MSCSPLSSICGSVVWNGSENIDPPTLSPIFRSSSSSSSPGSHESDENETSKPGPIEDTDNYYTVEKIEDYVYENGAGKYFVKWVGWPSSTNTWEPLENLDDCDEALIEFFLERRRVIEELRLQEKADDGNGERRIKRARKPALPRDPRPIEVIANEFYESTFQPSLEEKKTCEKEYWAKMTSEKSPAFVWSKERLIRVLGLARQDIASAHYVEVLRSQILYFELQQKHETNMEALREWENVMNVMSSGNPTLRVENNVDLTGPPTDFTYINEYKAGPEVTLPNDDPPIGCECEDCFNEKDNGQCCPEQSESEFAYKKHGQLQLEPGQPIYECNKKCKCGPDCSNRVVQHGNKKLRLAIYRTENLGWGVKTLRDIKAGTYISCYVGEIIGFEESERRGHAREQADAPNYLFGLDFNENVHPTYTVDATRYGNLTHFINHSCSPNLSVFPVWINCLDPDLPHLAFFAMKNIEKDEQLFFDYKNMAGKEQHDDSVSSKNSVDMDDLDEDGSELDTSKRAETKCFCFSENCRGYVF